MQHATFVTAAQDVLRHLPQRRRLAPGQLLAQWAEFVELAVGGYPLSWYDFDNERRVRTAIQELLDAPNLRAYPDFSEWANRVNQIDERYSALLVDLPGAGELDWPWWLRRVPRYAGPELAEDLKSMYGLQVEVAA